MYVMHGMKNALVHFILMHIKITQYKLSQVLLLKKH
jgi:hypothetical protein